MHFSKCLVKVFLVEVAAGAGTAFGFGTVAIAVGYVLQRQTKPVIDALKNHDKDENKKDAE